ncbi:hypothetical protein X777_16610, partial [Ooceraea biroi]
GFQLENDILLSSLIYLCLILYLHPAVRVATLRPVVIYFTYFKNLKFYLAHWGQILAREKGNEVSPLFSCYIIERKQI